MLTRPKGYIKEKILCYLLCGLNTEIIRGLFRPPSIATSFITKPFDYIGKKEQKGEIFVIRPPFELPVGKAESDPERLKEAYEIGRRETEMRLEELKAFLSGN